ncbi:MAG: ribokinase [Coriobacteriales bacterium]|nr:ribokinase [Actinomycetes bacterium]
MIDVAVVGSVNVDRSVDVPEAPKRGATILGSAVRRGPGGKGANQAVALARLQRTVVLVGAVGHDPDGEWMQEVLDSEGVGTSCVRRLDVPTGQAFVFVEPDGESTIVVSPGANGALTAAHIDENAGTIADARCVLAQQEVPAEAIARAAMHCRGLLVLNPAPARRVAPEVLARVDVLVPNRVELAELAMQPVPEDVEQVIAVARALRGPAAVVVTLGSDGCVVVTPERADHVPAVPVKAVDATAAGDTFCAALVDGLLGGGTLLEAARWANAAAARAVERRGAQESIPRRVELV